MLNASITDCVFEVDRETSIEEVNGLLKEASEGELIGVLDFEDRPLVSSVFRTDKHSLISDAKSTMVIDETQVKIIVWYHNEWGTRTGW